MKYSDSRILIFSKAPIPGKVKTRLVPAIGELKAAVFHQYLTESQIKMALHADCSPVELWCAPDCSHPFFQACSSNYAIKMNVQQGSDLGERLFHALQRTLQQSEYVVIVGSDVPSLGGDDLVAAVEKLASGYDAVFSPTEDGGYGLVGVRRVATQLFSNIDWGTSRVMEQTRQQLVRLGWRWHELPTCWDLDRPEDLARLAGWPLPPEIASIVELAGR